MGGKRQLRAKRSTFFDSKIWVKPKRCNVVDKRLQHLLSDLPPINFSIQPHILFQRKQWLVKLNHSSGLAITKSWLLPTTTRCAAAAHQRPQLRHVATAGGPSKNPNQYEFTMHDPFDAKKKPMEFENVARCGGKSYATSLQGALAVMEVIDARLQITGVGVMRAVPSIPSRFFKEYMVVMEEEILLVFLIHERSLEVVDHVEVFRLDLNKLVLVKVERLRGKTMFVKEKCVWVNSAEYGCRDNCVLFTEGMENKWRVYNIKTCCISTVLLEK